METGIYQPQGALGTGIKDGSGRALLVGAGDGREMAELGRLAQTLGLSVVDVLEQPRKDRVGYVGRGKREELARKVRSLGAEFVVTDDELSASQIRVLEKDAEVPIIDRTALIIRIFGAHAKDRPSRLEVELAELEYKLPRIKGGSEALSRLGGGVGTRGPGEQQLEYDRREIRRRINTINHRLEAERAAREVRRSRLKQVSLPSITLAGYTNAGKTTILNALTNAGRSTRNRLFETLETTTRRVGLPSMPDIVITDTVGFIKKLPTQLVHSFASTLESVRDSDLLVICADASSSELESELQTVEKTLREAIGDEEYNDRDIILCLNKADMVHSDDLSSSLRSLMSDWNSRDGEEHIRRSVLISAIDDISPLFDRIHSVISLRRSRIRLLIPHDEYGAANALWKDTEIHSSSHTVDGLLIEVTLAEPDLTKYKKYSV